MAEPKAPGSLARTLAAPFRTERSLFVGMKIRADEALKRLEHLEQATRPPIRKTMEEMGAKVAAAQRDKPALAVRRDER